MNIKFLKSDSLIILKNNIHENINKYKEPTKNEWVNDFFKNHNIENPFADYVTEFKDFSLKFLPENDRSDVSKIDVENVKIMYTALKNLPIIHATDERFWVGLSHTKFWDYMLNRWNNEKKYKGEEEDKIKSRYFFAQSEKRSLIINTLARLWWVGYHTYDENNASNPFELTEYFNSDFGTKALNIFSNNFTNSQKVTRGFIKALIKIDKEYDFYQFKKSRDIFIESSKFLNILGGTSIIDFFEEEEITDKVLEYMKNTYKKQLN